MSKYHQYLESTRKGWDEGPVRIENTDEGWALYWNTTSGPRECMVGYRTRKEALEDRAFIFKNRYGKSDA